MGLENKQAREQMTKNVNAYKAAVKYLDGCGELTLEKLIEARRIAGAGPDDSWFRTMWVKSQGILPGVREGPGGREQLRYDMRKTMVQAIRQFEDLLGPTEKSTPKRWQFWK
ncbi:MAG TPA: hypothetical protein VKM93_11615 [Terriglobia bacterium]|nr:hypothetical protein [Terriglobia bacterium]